MRFWYNPNFLTIVAIIILSVPALKSLGLGGFYTSHDGATHTARIAQYYQALADGQFPPRFAGSFYNGIGSPIFVYIYPLPYLLGSAIHALGFSFVDSFKILMAVGFIGSAIFAFLWLREIFERERAALVGAIFYVWVPYRFLLMYVRASLSEQLAYTFLPLLLFSVTKLIKENSLKWVAISALCFAFVLLSQNLVALIIVPVVFGYSLVQSYLNRALKSFLLVLTSSLWGLAISSFTYLPALFERKFVKIDDVIQHQFVNHFVTLKQLIHSPWGYGFDLPGVINDQMSFQVGLAHILVLLIAVVFLTLPLFFKKTPFFFDKPSKETLTISFYFLVVVFTSTIMMLQLDVVKSIWEALKPLQIIDLPWRFLGLMPLSIALLATFVAKNIKSGLFALFLIIAVIVANRNHLKINQRIFYSDEFFMNYSDTATQYGEFSTKWRGYLSVPEHIDPNVKLETVSGEAMIKDQLIKSNKLKFAADVLSSKAFIKINKIYFPGVQVAVNGQKLEPFSQVIIPSGELDYSKEDNGLMIIPLEKGVHKVEVFFGETTLRQFANFLSLGSFLLALLSIRLFRKRT